MLPDSQKQNTRYQIVHLLKTGGPNTAGDLGKRLGISAMAVRQHLISLKGDGFIGRYQEQGALGRPSHVYALTERGDEHFFPRTYDHLAVSLLGAIRDLEGEAGVGKIFRHLNKELEARYQPHLIDKALDAQVEALARMRTDEGFMVDWEQLDEDTFILRENNCAIYQVACDCSQACLYEQELFSKVLGSAEVERNTHILSGDLNCTYLIQRKRVA